jgi:hypothetical protein
MFRASYRAQLQDRSRPHGLRLLALGDKRGAADDAASTA